QPRGPRLCARDHRDVGAPVVPPPPAPRRAAGVAAAPHASPRRSLRCPLCSGARDEPLQPRPPRAPARPRLPPPLPPLRGRPRVRPPPPPRALPRHRRPPPHAGRGLNGAEPPVPEDAAPSREPETRAAGRVGVSYKIRSRP